MKEGKLERPEIKNSFINEPNEEQNEEYELVEADYEEEDMGEMYEDYSNDNDWINKILFINNICFIYIHSSVLNIKTLLIKFYKLN